MEDIQRAVNSNDLALLEAAFNAYCEREPRNETKLVVDSAIRCHLTQLIANDASKDALLSLISFAIEAARKELVGSSVPIVMLSDIFDSSTTGVCQEMFGFIEEHIPVWRSEPFFEPCRNHLLRVCNDLLRRLSRSLDTVFCGRILVFLARVLPLMEKSGLNLMSQFNVENTTKFEQIEAKDSLPSPVAKDYNENAGMEMEEGEMLDSATMSVIDFGLYCKFWHLQQFFSRPHKCLEKSSWKTFQQDTNEVLRALGSFKLENVEGPSVKKSRLDSSECVVPATPDWGNEEFRFNSMWKSKGKEIYFAKYLTNQKLLQLQLNDSNFRRYVLVQFLILFQYLSGEVRHPKEKRASLSEDQQNWIDKTKKSVYDLIKETHPDGEGFSEAVKHILDREKYWSEWKQNGCTDIAKRATSTELPLFKRKARQSYDHSGVDLGRPELSRLWRQTDNFDSCKGLNRNFVPKFPEFLAGVLETELKMGKTREDVAKDENIQFRALRLASKSSTHFFVQQQYLKGQTDLHAFFLNLIKKTMEDHPDVFKEVRRLEEEALEAQKAAERAALIKSVGNEDVTQNGASPGQSEKTGDTDPDENRLKESPKDRFVSEEQMISLSKHFAEKVQKLQKCLCDLDDCFSSVDISEPEKGCLNMLGLWKEKEEKIATVARLICLLSDGSLLDDDVKAILEIV